MRQRDFLINLGRVKILNCSCLHIADYFASIFWRYIEKSENYFCPVIKTKIKRIVYDLE